MPSNQTPNYQLSQWEKTDRVLMDDFNSDNAKIDGALGAHAASLAALETSKGNCRIWTTSYTGDGKYGEAHSNRVEFPWMPSVVLVIGDNGALLSMFYGARGGMFHAGSSSLAALTWTERDVQWYSNGATGQMNGAGHLYLVAAFGSV